MPAAYTGKILSVDLSEGTVRDEAISDDVYRRFLGGMGLGAWYLYDRVPAGADALGPDNILGFVPGLLTGSGSLYTGRWTACAKSPLTGGWGDANCGGTLAPAIKSCGYDGVFVRGTSPRPVVLRIGNKGGALEDAGGLWGLDAIETEERILASWTGPKRPSIACIGTAGEKLSLISGIVTDKGRLAARSGLGAVMGSKRLKAVVVSGTKSLPCADRAAVRALSAGCAAKVPRGFPLLPGSMLKLLGAAMRAMPLSLRLDGILYMAILARWGTAGMNQVSIEMGDSPIKNWSGSERDFPPSASNGIQPDALLARQTRAYHCYSCPTGCGGLCSFDGRETHKPEYESVLALSGLLMSPDLDAVFRMNDVLNRAGMDTISAGGSVALAIECAESGLLSRAELGGLDLGWGKTAAAEELVRLMAAREGIGAIFADGAAKAAERIGDKAAGLAIHAGGQELAMHDPRNDPGFGLHAAVDPTPGRHTVGSQLYYDMFQLWRKLADAPRPPLLAPKSRKYAVDPEKASAAALNSSYIALFNGAGLCLFGSFLGAHRLPLFDWLDAANGWKRSPEEYMEVGLRIQTLRQLFGIRQGEDPSRRRPSARSLGSPPPERGANKGRSVDLDAMVQAYWARLDWPGGVPSAASLERLGLTPPEGSHA